MRFYAFLGVFVCHTLPFEAAFYRRFHLPMPWLWGAVAKSGAAGVDLFFALSAFLITSLLLRERRGDGRNFAPADSISGASCASGRCTFCDCPGRRARPYHGEAESSLVLRCRLFLFVGNWVHAVFGRPESICSPLWTVSIEEQFYLIWPLLMKMLDRRGMIVAAIVTFLLATVCQVGFVLAGSSGGYIYYGSASRCDSLSAGYLLALFADRLPRLTARRALAAGGQAACWDGSRLRRGLTISRVR